jgi:uncharacterized RDD family membrane protein YckC
MGAGDGPAGATLAEPWKRIVALFLDWLLLGIVGTVIAVSFGVGSVLTATEFDSNRLTAGVVSTAVAYLYYALLIGRTGQTLAGMLLGVKVVRSDGSAVTQDVAFKREAWHLLAVVPWLGGLAQLGLVIWGLVTLFTDPMRQTPWDRFADTVVVDA